jgi:hypothetical protein
MALAHCRELAMRGSVDGSTRPAGNKLVNSEPESVPVKGQWLRLDLPLAANSTPRENHIAQLRIAYRPDEEEGGRAVIDPARTRLVLQIDLDEAGTIQVDLSMANHRIGAQVTTTNEGLRSLAESELPSLATGLERLGYSLQAARCEVSSLEPEEILDPFDRLRAGPFDRLGAGPFDRLGFYEISIQV